MLLKVYFCMAESKYLISVIIPVHNTAAYLKRCVESVRSQTLEKIEIILVDNLSVDDSPRLCDEYALIDERIKVLHLSEAGLSIARNAGIEVATAPYIGFVDSDDYIEPSMYADMLDAMQHNSVSVAYCNYCLEYDGGRKKQVYPDEGGLHIRSSKDVQRDIICEKVSSSACTKLFERSFFTSYRFPVGVFFEDHATIYYWLESCDKIAWIDQSYYHYIQRSDSICHTIGAEKNYHFFLAEYPRLDYVRKNLLCDGQDPDRMINLIVRNCLGFFNDFLKSPDAKLYPTYMKDMKRKLANWLDLSSDELDPKYYKRLRKIAHFWWLYYWTHSSKK